MIFKLPSCNMGAIFRWSSGTFAVLVGVLRLWERYFVRAEEQPTKMFIDRVMELQRAARTV